MKLKSFLLFGLATAVLVVTSCKEANLFDREKYEEIVKNTFPVQDVDPQQDWTTTKTISVIVGLDNYPADDYTVKIYSDNPVNKGATLYATGFLNASGTVSFPVPTSESDSLVYITVEGKAGKIINSYVMLENRSTINVGNFATRAATGTCPTTQGETYTFEFFPHQDANGVWSNYSDNFTKLNNVTTSRGNTWRAGDFKSVLSDDDAIFKEGVNNATKWKDVLENRVEYVMAEDGTVTLDLNFRNTSGQNKIGYFYYQGDSFDPFTIKKYILIDNSAQSDYIQVANYQSWDKSWGAWSDASTQINLQYYDDNTLFRGTQFELVYFGPNGENAQGSYTFPKGTHILFFLIQDNGYVGNNNVFMSDPSFNFAEINTGGQVYAATYRYGGITYLGFEDWRNGDYDLNDVLFFATGNFVPPTEVTPDPEDTPQTYTFCFEDNFPQPGDYDFNDVVMGVEMDRIKGDRDTLKIDVTLKAVGASKRLAAAMRLKGITTDMVASEFKRTGNGNFYYYGYGEQDMLAQCENKNYMVMTGTNEAVVPVFNDAHYCINGGVKEYGDLPKRRFYNTMADRLNEKGEVVEPKTITFKIISKDKDSDVFNAFTINDLDLFILEEYNGSVFEVHTYPFKTDEVIYEWAAKDGGSYSPYSDNYPWGIMVPGSFRYPVEWQPIGIYKNNIISGAYLGFGYWAQDHNSYTDWYKSPQSSDLVY